MKGIILDLDMPYFSTFRKPTSTSLILTFPVPPFTTVRGMLANAMGLLRDDYSLQDIFRIGMSVLNKGDRNVEMAKILKLKPGMGKIVRDFPSSPISREFIVQPAFRYFIAGDMTEVEILYQALKSPQRPLYLGQSDDLVEYSISELMDVEPVISNEFFSAVNEVVADATLEKLPFKFRKNEKDWELESLILSLPNQYPVKTMKEMNGFLFGEITVQLF